MTSPVLSNYVKLSESIPKRLHFVDHAVVDREITDPHTKSPKKVRVLVFNVDQEDGIPVAKIYSVTSEKHAQQFAPYLDGKIYRGYDFIITMSGHGYLREYTVRIEPTAAV